MSNATPTSPYEPILDWSPYFDTKRSVVVGGASAQDDSAIVFNVYESHGRKDAPLFVMIHGAAHTALSFALLSKELKALLGDNINILAYDARGHGGTITGKNVKPLDCTPGSLATDLSNLLEAIYPDKKDLPEKVVLCGHSMGGTTSIHAAYSQVVPNLAAMCIFDVAQNMSNIPMETIQKGVGMRPLSFNSLQEAGPLPRHPQSQLGPRLLPPDADRLPNTRIPTRYVWRTDLHEVITYWDHWFVDMSAKFLAPKVPKLLVLAEDDRHVDAELKTGLQEGKFQLLVMPNSGHSLEEDEPELLAREVVAFWKKHGKEI
ncbi:Protein phosphatase methylesterase 1 [Podila epicladia]|nr:Protein phosphatase methylesterase 1 [Podila epicladia]KAG0083554.1 Protein phosphatase methylesterase 1 [Podila epicladia]